MRLQAWTSRDKAAQNSLYSDRHPILNLEKLNILCYVANERKIAMWWWMPAEWTFKDSTEVS